MKCVKYLVAATFMMGLICSARAADWPQFQGPDFNGISKETGLAKTWPKGGPKVLWEVAVGQGFSAPAIRDGEVYILDRTEDDPDDREDVLRCFDLKTGKEKWKYSYKAPGKTSFDGSRNPPTVDEKHVYTVGPFGDFYCFDRKMHKPVWNTHLLDDHGGAKANWGVGQSPVLYGKWVVVALQGDDIGIAAFDRETGKMAWKSKGLGKPSYVSPALFNMDGKDQFLAITAKAFPPEARARKKGKKGSSAKPAPPPASDAAFVSGPFGLYGISANDGAVLWQYDGWGCKWPIANAIHIGDGKLFMTGGYDAGSAMIQVKGSEVKELFKIEGIGSHIQQPILFGNHIYFDNCENGRADGLACLTLDGKLTWQTADIEDGPKYDRGSVMIADGMIYAIDKVGNLKMVKPDPKKYIEVASAPMLDGKSIWSPIALSDGLMVIRDHTTMKCVNVKNP